MSFDPAADYPLGTRRPDLVRTPAGRALEDVTVAAVRAGELAAEDIRATPGTLGLQSEIALAAGRRQLADNLARAAELAPVPDGVVLEIYTSLRPHRSTAGELEEWAERLESEFAAPLTAAFVRAANAVYSERGLLATSSERAGIPTL